MKKTHFYTLILIGTLAGLATGCASTTKPLQSGAENVVITNVPAPKSCEYVGHVSATDTNGSTQSYTSHRHLQVDQLNTLRNQALSLGANVVVLSQHETTYAQVNAAREKYQGAAKVTVVDKHIMSGNAYLCHADTLNTLATEKAISTSDLSNDS